MSYEVLTIPKFDKQAKRLLKKFPSLKKELERIGESLSQNPFHGSPLGFDCYKIRLAIASKGKGKSGGARIITHVHVSKNSVYLLSIYDKSEFQNISDSEIVQLLQDV